VRIRLLILVIFSLIISFQQASAQKKKKKQNIQMLPGAESLESIKIDGVKYDKMVGNVGFKQGTTYFYCNEALLNKKKNTLNATGNVRIKEETGMNITALTLDYDGNDKVAKLRKRVVLVDKTMTLTTENLDYNREKETGSYFGGGKIVDGGNTLTSRNGYFDKVNDFFDFTGNVILVSPDATIHTEKMRYNRKTKQVICTGPTKIIDKEGAVSEQNDLVYDTESKVVKVSKGGTVETEDFILNGINISVDDVKKISRFSGNVNLFAKKENVTIKSDFGTNNKATGVTKMYGKLLLANPVEGDTLYLTADTLMAIEKTATDKQIVAYRNVRLYKSDLQGKCDSLVYNFTDSTIYLYIDPVLWSQGSQMEADSMRIHMANKKIDRLYMRVNSFVISQDTLLNFNQVKGREIVAYFRNSRINKVNVNGNGESIYFALENDTATIGMNKILCARIQMLFGENNKLTKVSFYNQPEGTFFPPHELAEPEKRLKGFNWRDKERPARGQLIAVRKE
jgi:lipopolysaccharide export system protein LptA